MTYSGTAVIHGMILAAIRKQLAPQRVWDTYETLILLGATSNSTLPIIPMTWDVDQDTVLVIVGVAFLVVAPVQIFSR
jgi:hypothetical protein